MYHIVDTISDWHCWWDVVELELMHAISYHVCLWDPRPVDP